MRIQLALGGKLICLLILALLISACGATATFPTATIEAQEPVTEQLSSEILEKYNALGGADGILGALLGPDANTSGVTGSYADFENGSIYFNETVGAFQIGGAIRDKWLAEGGPAGYLGFPRTDELTTPDGRGLYNHFEHASIYWTPETGANVVMGLIYGKWEELGWEGGFLGYPTSDELDVGDGRGKYSNFENGSIYWSPETGANEVHGFIRTHWLDLQGLDLDLGYPTSDELVTADGVGRYQQFEFGNIYWHPDTGAFEVHGLILGKYVETGAEAGPLGYPISDEEPSTDAAWQVQNRFQHGVIRWHPEKGVEIFDSLY